MLNTKEDQKIVDMLYGIWRDPRVGSSEPKPISPHVPTFDEKLNLFKDEKKGGSQDFDRKIGGSNAFDGKLPSEVAIKIGRDPAFKEVRYKKQVPIVGGGKVDHMKGAGIFDALKDSYNKADARERRQFGGSNKTIDAKRTQSSSFPQEQNKATKKKILIEGAIKKLLK